MSLLAYMRICWRDYAIAAGGIVAVLGIIDYFWKWGISLFVIAIIKISFNYLFIHLEEIVLAILLMWCLVLTVLLLRKRRNGVSRGNDTTPVFSQEDVDNKLAPIKVELRDLKVKDGEHVKNITSMKSDIRELQRYERRALARQYESENRRGGITCRVDVLEMDIDDKSDWRIHETLEDIAQYLSKHVIDSEDAATLQKQLVRLSAEYTFIRDKVTKAIRI